jgi:membrane protein YqaA with SNARE-associated domain
MKKIDKKNIIFTYDHDHYIIRVIIIILILVLLFWAGNVISNDELISNIIRKYGYLGLFFISIISGFNLLIPIPAISFLPFFLNLKLNFLIIILVISIGVTTSDLLGFVLGRTSRYIILSNFENKILSRFEQIRKKLNWSPIIALFLFASFVPLPNEIMIIPMAILGYKFTYIFLSVFWGNLIFNFTYGIGIMSIKWLL